MFHTAATISSLALLCLSATHIEKVYAVQLQGLGSQQPPLLSSVDLSEETVASECEASHLSQSSSPTDPATENENEQPLRSQPQLIAYLGDATAGDAGVEIVYIEKPATVAGLEICSTAGLSQGGAGASHTSDACALVENTTQCAFFGPPVGVGGAVPNTPNIGSLIGLGSAGVGGILCGILCGGDDDPLDPAEVPEPSDMLLSLLFGGLGLSGVVYQHHRQHQT